MSSSQYTEDDIFESNFILGSGYGYGLAETPVSGVVAILLLNEDGDVLSELREFSVEDERFNPFLSNLTASISRGHGGLILRSTKRPLFEVEAAIAIALA